MIKLKFNCKEELKSMITFLKDHRPFLIVTGNHFYETLVQSVLIDVENIFNERFNKPGLKFGISLKIHEAIAIVTLWRDTTRPIPSYTDPTYNHVHQKLLFLQQKIS